MAADEGSPVGPLSLFCARLRRLQQATGITQTSLATAIHLGTSQMSDILSGKIKRVPDWDFIRTVVRACLEHADATGRPVPPDLHDERDWRRRYNDLELDLQTRGQRHRGSAVGRPLAEVTDPFALEVHRPVLPDTPQPDLPLLPTYVLREHDAELARVVREAADGSSGIAVLVGGSSTGKTRACWEALRLLRDKKPGWRLWHPIDPSRPDAVRRELPAVGPRTVVWLNDAQFYLDADAGVGEQVAAGLRELLRDPSLAPVLVLATLWPQFWDHLTTRPGDTDSHAQARELLAGRDIAVPTAFTTGQLQQLSEAGDVRLTQAAVAARDGQVIQFLAGAPELLSRYRNAPPAAVALMRAAMDARRMGVGVGLPRAFLAAAAPGYLSDTEWDALGEDWLEQAFAYTAVDCRGVRGPLTRIRPRPVGSRTAGADSRDNNKNKKAARNLGMPTYRLADYLDQHGRHLRKGQFPPGSFWVAAADHALPGDQVRLGYAAHNRGLYRVAAQLFKNAADSGSSDAVSFLGQAWHYLRADMESLRWVVAHAPLNDPHAVGIVLGGLWQIGVNEDIAALIRRDPAGHVSLDDLRAVAWLLHSLHRAGAKEQVTALADRAAAHASVDDLDAVTYLLDWMRLSSAEEQVAVLADRATTCVPVDDPHAVDRLLRRLRRAGAGEQVTVLAGRVAAHFPLDTQWAVASMLHSLREVGAEEQVVVLADRAVARVCLDDPGVVGQLLGCLHGIAAMAQVNALLHRDPANHVHLGNMGHVVFLLGCLGEAGAEEQVAVLADRAVARVCLDDPGAVGQLLRCLQHMGVVAQANALLRRDPAAHIRFHDLHDPFALPFLLGYLRDAGAEEQIAVLADRAAAQVPLDNPYAVSYLLDSLREIGAEEQVAVLADRAAARVSLNNPGAVTYLLNWLRKEGLQRHVNTVLHRDPASHVRLDDKEDVVKLLDWFHVAGAVEQVTALAHHVADHFSVDDAYAVSYLLDSLREIGAEEQIAVLADRAAAQVPLDNPYAVAHVLDSLRRVGAKRQIAVLAYRAAAQVPLDDPGAVADLVDSLRGAGTAHLNVLLHRGLADRVSIDDRQGVARLLNSLRKAGEEDLATRLADRLPEAGMFELYCEQEGRHGLLRFGLEADASPAAPWNWQDLN